MGEEVVSSHFVRDRANRGPVDHGVGGCGVVKNLEEIILMFECDVEVVEIEVHPQQ